MEMIEEGSKIGIYTNMRSLEGGDAYARRSTEFHSDVERKDLQIAESLENISNGGIDEHVVDIDKSVASLTMILEDVPQYMCTPGHPGRISRIPENLREVDTKAYEPYFVSFGPYHHGKPGVQRMEMRKQIVLKCVLEHNPEITLKDCLKEIKSIESAARRFYSNVEMESDKFVQMLLLDSLYIVTVLCGGAKTQERINHIDTTTGSRVHSEDKSEMTLINEDMENRESIENVQLTASEHESNGESSGGNISDRPRWFWVLLAHDLLLLENQLPFFVLEKIHNLVYGFSENRLILALVYEFGKLLAPYGSLNSNIVISPTEDIHHLLHLCHMFFRPTVQHQFSTYQFTECSQMFRLGNAVQLYEAGVTFELRSGSSHHTLLDITIGRPGTIVMPCLHVEDNTVSLLRNLIALEQMKYPSLGLDVSAYAVLLLHLITIPEDVKLLRRKGIIQHHLASDKEMVCLVNRLSVGLSFDYLEDKYNLKPIFQELKRYSERRVPKWSAGLKQGYFNNPWTTISLLAALVLLLLTVVQTYYAIYSYYHPFFDGHN